MVIQRQQSYDKKNSTQKSTTYDTYDNGEPKTFGFSHDSNQVTMHMINRKDGGTLIQNTCDSIL